MASQFETVEFDRHLKGTVEPGPRRWVALSPQQMARTHRLISVHLKAQVKGFQQQEVDLSCGSHSWRNEALQSRNLFDEIL